MVSEIPMLGQGGQQPYFSQPGRVPVVGKSAPVDSNTIAEMAASNVMPETDVTENSVPTQEIEVPTQRRIPSTQEDNGLTRLLSPRQGELEAAQRGDRWHWNLENSIMLPGTDWANNVRANAAIERDPDRYAYINQKQTQTDPKLLSGDFRVMANGIEKFIGEIDKGQWLDEVDDIDPNDPAYEERAEEIKSDKMRQYDKYNRVLSNMDGLFANSDSPEAMMAKEKIDFLKTNLDRAFKPFLGNWNTSDMKSAKGAMLLESNIAEIYDYFMAHRGKSGDIEDPNAAQTYQNMLGSLVDQYLKVATGSASNLADSAKVRELKSWLSPEDFNRSLEAMKGYQRFLSQMMGRTTDTSYDKAIVAATNAINELESSVKISDDSPERKKKIKEAWDKADTFIAKLSAQFEKLLGDDSIRLENTADSGAALQAAKDAYDTYVQGVLFGASINGRALMDAAQSAVNIGYNTANRMNKAFRRPGVGRPRRIDVSVLPTGTSGHKFTVKPKYQFTDEQVLDSGLKGSMDYGRPVRRPAKQAPPSTSDSMFDF